MMKTRNPEQNISTAILGAIANAVSQTDTAAAQLGNDFKPCNSEHGFYGKREEESWTEGFYTGELWLTYEWTGNAKYKDLALSQIPYYANRIEKRIMVDHHDMGFLYSPSCVAAYKLTGCHEAENAAVAAADNLLRRFQAKGQFLQAWGTLGAKDNYRLIIDCLMNLPLLYWASDVTGNQKYASTAEAHITTALANIVRPDYSTYHTFFFDPDTGAPSHGVTAQGYRNDSAWARGQAWGIYGVALSYRYTQKKEYIDLFCHITDYFLQHLPKDLVPYWDLIFTDGSEEPRDSSAAAIAICGMLEMSRYLTEDKAVYYRDKAMAILHSLMADYAVKDPKISNGQLLHSVYCKHTPYNTCHNHGVDECTAWGDYFYLEALMRVVQPDWQMYW